MTGELRFAGKIQSATISYRAGGWFVSIAVEVEHETPTHTGGTSGIDLGIKTLATLSDGTVFENQRHYCVACQRQDTLHKMTTHVTRTYALVGLEDLNAKGMLANHCLAQAMSDASFFEVKRHLLYKAEQHGGMCNWSIVGTPAQKPATIVAGSKKT